MMNRKEKTLNLHADSISLRRTAVSNAAVFRHLGLTAFVLLLLLLPLPAGGLFGSEGDWISQHVAVAESLRQAMIAQKTWIPQFIGLGGGSSVYEFSYYGLFRPDVILSCLFPNLEMKYVISLYAMFGVVASVNLCYLWLSRRRLSELFSLAGTVLFACAACFYQAHHQIMFVNYMPFLIMALLSVDTLLKRGKLCPLAVSLFFIYIHSFYYAPACLAVVFLYFLYESLYNRASHKDRHGMADRVLVKFLCAVVLSICLAAVLLLPTGLAILSTKKDGGSFAEAGLSPVDFTLEGLLYTPYGCGLTAINLYCLLHAVSGLQFRVKYAPEKGSKKQRKMGISKRNQRLLCLQGVFALTLLFIAFLPVASLVLNGFLYARAKILIPFLPLFCLVTAQRLRQFYLGRQRCSWLLFSFCLLPAIGSEWWPIVLIDCGILAVWIACQRMISIDNRKKQRIFWLAFLVPICFCFGVHMHDDYIKVNDTRQTLFSMAEQACSITDTQYRYDVLAHGLENCNLTAGESMNRTTMYSSVTNADYAAFFYDTMKNPIKIQNRVALLADENCFFQYFMGQRYLLTEKKHIPAGYHILSEKGGYALSENESVLPVCYGTSALMGEAEYSRLSYPENMEALCRYAVVPEYSADSGFSSHMEQQSAGMFFEETALKQLLEPDGTEKSFRLPLRTPLTGQALLMSFDVESKAGAQVDITVNGILNRLSSKNVPYPNHNHTFTYVISGDTPLTDLFITLSQGEYTVKELKLYTMDLQWLNHEKLYRTKAGQDGKSYREEETQAEKSESIFSGIICMQEDGYLITSYPYKKGYHVMVDGRQVEAQKVNTAFMGFPLAAGEHWISISYNAPGLMAGLFISGLSLALLFAAGIVEIRQKKKGAEYIRVSKEQKVA
ncbi:MAG: YfhO family protein [Lachnospiraceae bacterium]|nr:YfhO family protein [Lachnospiraceae bacterium]